MNLTAMFANLARRAFWLLLVALVLLQLAGTAIDGLVTAVTSNNRWSKGA